jgi:hypothetical protein
MRYFKKEIVSRPINASWGGRIQWQDIGGDVGVLQTDDERLIHELSQAAQNGRGGVVEIDEVTMEGLKKNPPQSRRSRSESVAGRHWAPPQPSQKPAVAAVVKAGGIPNYLPPNPGSDTPLEIPKASDFIAPPRPPTGRRSGVIAKSGTVPAIVEPVSMVSAKVA